ncbi:MAG: hypothetical protein QM756_43500 [Polyangiaceae bacterium]
MLGLSLSADAARATSLDRIGLVGPGLTLGRGGALGRFARYAVSASTLSAHSVAGDLFYFTRPPPSFGSSLL